ncbi:GTP-binding protein [Pseudonocardia saturnea]
MLCTLNLGIVAHVDAGKTSLTERLLYAAGVVDEIGSVDAGSTRTDSMALERERGITIRAAVESFAVGDLAVNLLDTPGHPDFIAEVERVLGVLDGAVLVVSAVEGVQPQTRVLMRALRRLRVPTLVFVNKIDRRDAREDGVLRELAASLTPDAVAMGTVRGIGARDASVVPFGPADAGFTARLVDGLLARWVRDGAAPHDRLLDGLAAATARSRAHPVFFGSAITGAGTDHLVAGIARLLPAGTGDVDGPLSGTVFAVDRAVSGERIASMRLFSGRLRARDVVGEEKVTGVAVVGSGAEVARAGQIARVRGLAGARIGDPIGVAPPDRGHRHFAPPTLESVVESADRGALHAALTQLAEQDPLIALRRDERGEIGVSLYGEVQKEVLAERLRREFGVAAALRATTTICVERPAGTGAAHELIGTASNPFLATVGLRVEPAPEGSGVRFGLAVELGSMPIAFVRAVEETVRLTLEQGLCGWAVTDCAVVLTHSGYWPRQSHAHATFDKAMSSTARDFRLLTPLVLMSALRRAGTRVCEPVHRFVLEIPESTYGTVLPLLTGLGGIPDTVTARDGTYEVGGTLPAARVHGLRQRLPTLTSGEWVLEVEFDSYRATVGPPPARPRTDADPLDRAGYLLRIGRR